MATIAGPKVQVPQAMAPFVDENGNPSLEAATFLRTIASIAFYTTRSGPTASRPTTSAFRWVGMPYFDTSLGAKGKPIYLAIASSNAWVLADGTAA